MSVHTPPGVFDIIPQDLKEPWKSSYLWDHIESLIRKTAKEFGYKEIRTPLFERTELFARGVGDTSDIVSKEMYTFIDRGERSLSLRPEGTAPVMRAFIEHSLNQRLPLHKLFYIGPMFRYERSQQGRYRQHHQFGAEAIGSKKPEQDVELIDLLYTLYSRLGLKDLHVYLNSIGDTESRIKYRKALQDFLRKDFDNLSEDSKARFEKNPLRILDSKHPQDQGIIEQAPSILDYLSEECLDHFNEVKKLLDLLNIPYEVNPHLVRGLDYYNNTVFEIVAKELGAQNSIGGGGRYDGLLKTLGGPDLPAIGFGTGLERIIQTLLQQGVLVPDQMRPLLFFVPLGQEAKETCFSLVHDLRAQGLPVQMDYSGRKLSKMMHYADQIRAQFVAVVGDEEIKSKEVELKEMDTGEKISAPLHHLGRILRIEMEKEAFVQLWKEMAAPFEKAGEAEFFVKKMMRTISQTSEVSRNLQTAVEDMNKLLED